MTCKHPDPELCQLLGMHLHTRTWDIWNSRNIAPEKARIYRQRWIAKAPTEAQPELLKLAAISEKLPCVHRGDVIRDEETGRAVPACLPCQAKGNISPIMYACTVYGRCTLLIRVDDVPGCCKGCQDYKAPPLPIVLNQGAAGLGDSISATAAVNAFRKLHAASGRRIVYKVSGHAEPFVRLLDMGPVEIGRHHWDEGQDQPKNADQLDIQLNPGHAREWETNGQFTRVQRNCRNAGGVLPDLPALRDRNRLFSAGRDMEGAICLCPFSTWESREWPVQFWGILEKKLREHGYRVLIMDGLTYNRPKRSDSLTSEKLIDAPADRVVGVLLNAAVVVANDSGLAHVAGIAGVPSLILCALLPGECIFKVYGPHMQWIDKPNMVGFSVDEVFEKTIALAGPPRTPANRNGETAKAHARRIREGWYAKYVQAPCLDVGCWVDYLLPGFPCDRWDQMYGDTDATVLYGVSEASYACVYASHVLEHIDDPVTALRNWWRVLRPGGTLIVAVPDAKLYEGKLDLPSRWNPDHRTFWRLEAPLADDPPHFRGLRQVFQQAIPGVEPVSLCVLDEGHNYQDKSVHPRGEFSLEVILRKPLLP